MGDLTEHFSWWEFECSCGCTMPPEVKPRIIALAKDLEAGLRQPLNLPVTINSGYRCWAYNRRIDGVENSEHLLGRAADLEVVGKTGHFIAGFLESQILMNRIPQGGVGTYQTYPRMCHYDNRGTRARWHRGRGER